MADYQSLLARAVANLPNASKVETRQAIYDRARTALVTQLRSLRPPLPESDIEREERALDKAIAQVELQFAPLGAAPAADAETTSSPPASPTRMAAAPATAPSTIATPQHGAASSSGAGATNRPVAKSFPRAAAAVSAAATQPRPASRPLAPTPPTKSRPAPPSSKPYPKPASPPASPTPSNAAKPPPVQIAPQKGELANAGAVPPVTLAKTDNGEAAPANLTKVVPSAPTDQGERDSAPPVTATIADDVAQANVALVSPVDVDRLVAAEGQRPVAPKLAGEKRRSWPWLVLAVVLGVVLSIAAAAIVMRQKPQDLAIATPPEKQQEVAQAPTKIAQRAQPTPGENNASKPPTPAPAGEPQASQNTSERQAAPPEAQSAAELPVAGRAAMLIASPDNPQKPVVNLGSTVWSTIPAAPGQPATVAVKADADIPDLKMHATMTLRKNTDPTLEATSHDRSQVHLRRWGPDHRI